MKKVNFYLRFLVIFVYTDHERRPLVKTFMLTDHLTDEMITFYQDNGFLILNNFLTPDECEDLVSEGAKLIEDFNPTLETTEVFSAQTVGAEAKRGAYFEDSADKISFFFEEDAFKDGKQTIETKKAINKIGHALGELNDKFRAITFKPIVGKIAQQLGVANPALNQSMLIYKSAKVGGEVKPHQDSTFLYTEPHSTTAFWIPLQDATTQNACLYAIPGSHKWPLLARYVKNKDQPGFGFTDLDGNTLQANEVEEMMKKWPEEKFVPLPMDKGSVIIFSGTLVHGSGPNLSDKSRNAYTFHVISGDALYPQDNWLQRAEFTRI